MLALIERIRQEYLALPGLKLTVAQARHMWPARDGVFTAAMDTLAAQGFLRYLPSGFYIAAPRPEGTAANPELAPIEGPVDAMPSLLEAQDRDPRTDAHRIEPDHSAVHRARTYCDGLSDFALSAAANTRDTNLNITKALARGLGVPAGIDEAPHTAIVAAIG